MHKMLFNTGVRVENHCYLSGQNKGKLITGEFEEWHGGTLHKVYFLESAPPADWRVKWLCDNPEPGDLSMPIIGGGMLSRFAIFQKVGA